MQTAQTLDGEEQQFTLNATDWNQPASSAFQDDDAVSPRTSQGDGFGGTETPEDAEQQQQQQKHRDMAAGAAAPLHPLSAGSALSSASQPEPCLGAAAATSPELLAAVLTTVGGELRMVCDELKTIIREEVRQLHNSSTAGEKQATRTSLSNNSSNSSSSAAVLPSWPAATPIVRGDIRYSSLDLTSALPSQPATRRDKTSQDATDHSLQRERGESRWHQSQPGSDASEPGAIDQAWGPLFDSQGFPTARLDEVLRGLGNYIVKELPPRSSIVITPEKLASFYSLFGDSKEPHAYTSIFKSTSRDRDDKLADLYLDLGCQYHLVPKDTKSAPCVPGLTPAGFARWIRIHILACPDREARRLDRIVSECPIDADSSSDGKSERLPKQIPRRLLPDKPDRKTRSLLDGAMRDLDELYPVYPSSSRPRDHDEELEEKDTMLPLPRPHQHHRRHSSNSSAVAKERRPSGTGGAPRPRLTPSPSESANDDGWNQRHHHEHGRRTSASKESSSHYNDADSGNKHKADQKAAYLAPPSSVSSRRNRSPARLPSSRDQHAYRHAFPEIHNSSSSNSNAGAPARRPSLMAPIPTIELTASPRDRDRDHRGRDEHEYRRYSSPRTSRASLGGRETSPRSSRRMSATAADDYDKRAHGWEEQQPQRQWAHPPSSPVGTAASAGGPRSVTFADGSSPGFPPPSG